MQINIFKPAGVALLVADPPPASSTTDTNAHPISYPLVTHKLPLVTNEYLHVVEVDI